MSPREQAGLRPVCDPEYVRRHAGIAMTAEAELLARFAPWLCYDAQEAFFADDAAQMCVNPGSRLLRKAGDGPAEVVAATAPAAGPADLTLDLLDAGQYHDAAGSKVKPGDRLSISGSNYRDQYS